jgi:glycosyltransferase involved in cell wall biosynthesis
MKIWYLSRTYRPEKTGGALIRMAQVDCLGSNGIEVVVVAPDYAGHDRTISGGEIRVAYRTSRIRFDQMLERLGVYEDYLDMWVDENLALLKSRVGSDDLVFATSGGELGCIKLGSLLKDKTGCSFVVNLHDPVDYTQVFGRKINGIPHVSRERQERRYLANADLVITSSRSNQDSLTAKYPEMADRIRCSYFGFITPADLREKAPAPGLTVVYGGTYDKNQSPELLAKAVQGLENVTAHFVGRHAAYKPLDFARANQANCRFFDQMSYPDFLRHLGEHADLGFLSLASLFLGVCVPSKLFEYINIGLPVLGALPQGDAHELINSLGYGISCAFDDTAGLRAVIQRIADDKQLLGSYRARILADRDEWYMPNRMAEVLQWLQNL